MPQKPHICAIWGDTGHVHIWDFACNLNALALSETNISKDASMVSNQTPLVKFSGHKYEGYAIVWNPLVPGMLVSGDCKNYIHLWEPSSDSTWNVGSNQYVGHTGSVEDLQWSPTEATVFASCSVDKTIAIWDSRTRRSPATSIKAHNTDVNVISWNKCVSLFI
ncbi:hypothetical protein L2E82_46011 [Cichorium intybus]|uniref:Uncharacterized protein n=1 Tax=Cichorium intybus TaxID=13427 RepID=A0ACB8ZU44_CICIN|nr:hypothetical protein L2E82_46011 [Cichorium intybus]